MRSALSTDEAHIWMLIAVRRGRAQAISVHDVSTGTGLSDRTVRRIVKVLIEQHHCPIASSPQPPAGYFMPETLPEIVETLESLKGRALSILTRMSRLRQSTLRETVDQLLLDVDTAA